MLAVLAAVLVDVGKWIYAQLLAKPTPEAAETIRSLSKRVRPTVYERDGRFSWHVRSLLLSAIPLTAMAFAITAGASPPQPLTGAGEFLCQSADVWWVVFGVSYSVYLLEALLIPAAVGWIEDGTVFRSQCNGSWCTRLFSSTLLYLLQRKGVDDSRAYMQQLQQTRPEINMHIETYHFETTTSGSGKNKSTTTKKVVTHVVDRQVQFRSWADCSGELPDVRSRPQKLLKVKQTLVVEPLDKATAAHLKASAETFKAEFRGKDTHMEYREATRLDGFRAKMLVVDKPIGELVGPCLYALSAVCLLSWPVHLYLERISFRATWHIKKVLSIGDLEEQLRESSHGALQAANTFTSEYDAQVPIVQATFVEENTTTTTAEYEAIPVVQAEVV